MTPPGAAHWFCGVRVKPAGQVMRARLQRTPRVVVAAPPLAILQPLVQRVVRRDVAWQTEVEIRLKPGGQSPQVTPWVAVAAIRGRQGETWVAGQVETPTAPWQPARAQVNPVGHVRHCGLYAHTTPEPADPGGGGPQSTPKVAVGAFMTTQFCGQVLTPRVARQPPLMLIKPRGQRTCVGILVEGARDGRKDLVGLTVGDLSLDGRIVGSAVGRLVGRTIGARVVPAGTAARKRRHGPTGQTVVAGMGAWQPPLTRRHPRGHLIGVLRAHVTPLVDVARANLFQKVGHMEMPNGARHPPGTRRQPAGQVSVVVLGRHTTPNVLVARDTTSQFLGQVLTPLLARQPREMRVKPAGQVPIKMGVGFLVVGRLVGRSLVVVLHVTPVVVVGFAVTRQPDGQALVPRGAVHPSGLLIQGVGTDGHRERPHVMP